MAVKEQFPIPLIEIFGPVCVVSCEVTTGYYWLLLVTIGYYWLRFVNTILLL